MKGLFALLRSGTVKRCRVYFGVLFLLAGIIGTSVRAELTEEEKRQLFLKAREEMRTVPSPTPTETPSPAHKPKPAKHPPKHKKSPTPEPEETAEPTVKAKRPTPPPREHPVSAAPARSRRSRRRRLPRPSCQLTARQPAGRARAGDCAKIRLRKTFRFLADSVSSLWKTLSVSYALGSLRDRSCAGAGSAAAMAIHHRAQQRHAAGQARMFFDYYHRHVRRMVNGLAYHFRYRQRDFDRERRDRNWRPLATTN